VPLPQLTPVLPLAGWIDLEWGDSVEVVELAPRERLRRLARRRTFPQLLPVGETLLELVGLPAYVLRRPRRWTAFGDALERMLELAGAARAPAADSRSPA
jgi:hypothetical protein